MLFDVAHDEGNALGCRLAVGQALGASCRGLHSCENRRDDTPRENCRETHDADRRPDHASELHDANIAAARAPGLARADFIPVASPIRHWAPRQMPPTSAAHRPATGSCRAINRTGTAPAGPASAAPPETVSAAGLQNAARRT